MNWKDMIGGQFGAAIDMLENAVRACPEHLWSEPAAGGVSFWYTAVHALYFLDVYLDESEEACVPPAPFAREDAGVAARPDRDSPYGERLVAWARLDGLRLPDRPYARDQVLGYLAHGRAKCQKALAAMTDAEAAAEAGGFPWLGLSRAELMLYNMRHVQHHAAQLNLLLRQGVDAAPAWVRRAATPTARA